MLVRIPQYSQKLVEQKKIKEETNKKKKKENSISHVSGVV